MRTIHILLCLPILTPIILHATPPQDPNKPPQTNPAPAATLPGGRATTGRALNVTNVSPDDQKILLAFAAQYMDILKTRKFDDLRAICQDKDVLEKRLTYIKDQEFLSYDLSGAQYTFKLPVGSNVIRFKAAEIKIHTRRSGDERDATYEINLFVTIKDNKVIITHFPTKEEL